MPKENKQRGRRTEEKKRKLEAEDNVHLQAPKRRKSHPTETDHAFASEDKQNDHGSCTHLEDNARLAEAPFYGILDEEEQEYFKRADHMLELDQFGDAEGRDLFLANVYREAEGKELKLANSQSCSRLMERLILLSTPAQLKRVFQKFAGNFLYLVQHRFASHCCEALFAHSASAITDELLDPVEEKADNVNGFASSHASKSLEELFLDAVTELEGNLGYLMTAKFASHTLRVLLVVLSGQCLADVTTKSLLQSKKKENVGVPGVQQDMEMTSKERTVPASFATALEKTITNCVAGIDTAFLRTLATHPTGNPTLQLLLQIELSQFGKQRAKEDNSIIRKLLPDCPIAEGSESGPFINGLLYDPVGSRLLETIIQYAPGKMFKALYKEFFKARLGTMARSETAGYVVCRLLERLSKEDLEEAAEIIIPHVSALVERGRTYVIKVLVERCAVRGANMDPIASELEKAYMVNSGGSIAGLLGIDADPVNGKVLEPRQRPSKEKLHGSLLVQAMAAVPGPLSTLVFDYLLALDTSISLALAKDQTGSHALQAAMVSRNASIIFRRKMIQQFYGHMGELAVDPYGSHVVDKIWDATHGLAFIRERVAEELAENETSLRESFFGRAVWRNWKMDLYKRRRSEWVEHSKAKAGNDGFQAFPDLRTQKENQAGKTKLELARARHAASKAKKGKGAEGASRESGPGGNAGSHCQKR